MEIRALDRLSFPELVRGSVRGGTSSTTQFMPVIERTLSRISSRRRLRSALSEVRQWTSTAGVSSPPRRGDWEGGNAARLESGQLLHAPFDIMRPIVLAVNEYHIFCARTE